MGSWNATPLGNDTAMDWLSELCGLTSHSDGRALISTTLSRIGPGDRAVASDAEEAIAAAAVVAAAASDPIGAMVADGKRWILTHGFAPDLEMLESARRAMTAICSASELRELWEESGELKAWLRQVGKVVERLERARLLGIPARTPKAPGIPRSLHRMVAHYAMHRDAKLREKIGAKLAALKDPDGKTADTDFETPLTLVARHGLLEEALALLARGADPRLESSRAFVESCAAGHLDVAKALHAAGATLFHEHRASSTPGLSVQVEITDPSEAEQGHRYCLALFSVARRGPPVAADFLRTLGASLDQTDLNGETLLHKAAESGCILMLNYLLDSGLDVNRAKGQSGESPLHYATRAKQLEAVRVLLERGANPNVVDRFDGELHQWRQTPLDIAESPEIRSLLIAHGARTAEPG